MHLDDALGHQEGLHCMYNHHEQACAMAAEAYARIHNKIAAVCVTTGPGGTNALTGVVGGWLDSIPMFIISGQVRYDTTARYALQYTETPLRAMGDQEYDIVKSVEHMTKYAVMIEDPEQIRYALEKAWHLATTGRPGPVLVDITKDVTANVADFEPKVPETIERVTSSISEEDLDKAVRLIDKANAPMILVGGGVITADASKELKKFAAKIDAPVCDTLMGKGAFNGTDERYTGMIGMHGTKVSNFGINQADLVIVIGARFSDRVTGNTSKFAKNAKIIHIDVDAAEINKNIIVDCSVVGDAKEILKLLTTRVKTVKHDEWMQEIAQLKEKYPDHADLKNLTGPAIINKIYEITKGKATITTDVGQHQMWAAQYFSYSRPRQFLSSGGLGTMGFGVGACIGAKVGVPENITVNIAGDGCFRMNMNEIATAARYNIPIIQVVINNHVLGMVRQWQTLFYDKRYSNTVLNDSVDFVKVAEGLGATGIRVTTLAEFEDAMKKAVKANGPVVIDCMIGEDDKVWPMVAAGAALETCFDDLDLAKKEK